jgi:hypothetical protein
MCYCCLNQYQDKRHQCHLEVNEIHADSVKKKNQDTITLNANLGKQSLRSHRKVPRVMLRSGRTSLWAFAL